MSIQFAGCAWLRVNLAAEPMLYWIGCAETSPVNITNDNRTIHCYGETVFMSS